MAKRSFEEELAEFKLAYASAASERDYLNASCNIRNSQLAEARERIAMLERDVERLKAQLEFGCECTPEGCDCFGCSLAASCGGDVEVLLAKRGALDKGEVQK